MRISGRPRRIGNVTKNGSNPHGTHPPSTLSIAELDGTHIGICRQVSDVWGARHGIGWTLIADTRRGSRPSFTDAAAPDLAEPLYEAFCTSLAAEGVPVARGVFGARMGVSLVNDGPVTILLEA